MVLPAGQVPCRSATPPGDWTGREGFEPSGPPRGPAALAPRCLQPLGHLPWKDGGGFEPPAPCFRSSCFRDRRIKPGSANHPWFAWGFGGPCVARQGHGPTWLNEGTGSPGPARIPSKTNRGTRIRTWINLLNREVTYRLAHTPLHFLAVPSMRAARSRGERSREARRSRADVRPPPLRSAARIETRATGFEPVVSAVTGRCPEPLDDAPEISGWEGSNFRPLRPQRSALPLRYSPCEKARGWIRTSGFRFCKPDPSTTRAHAPQFGSREPCAGRSRRAPCARLSRPARVSRLPN